MAAPAQGVIRVWRVPAGFGLGLLFANESGAVLMSPWSTLSTRGTVSSHSWASSATGIRSGRSPPIRRATSSAGCQLAHLPGRHNPRQPTRHRTSRHGCHIAAGGLTISSVVTMTVPAMTPRLSPFANRAYTRWQAARSAATLRCGTAVQCGRLCGLPGGDHQGHRLALANRGPLAQHGVTSVGGRRGMRSVLDLPALHDGRRVAPSFGGAYESAVRVPPY